MPRQALRDYPHLPVLTFEQAMSIFTHARISFNMLSTQAGHVGLLPFSRQSVYLWRKGRNPHPIAMDEVSVLAYRALANLRTRRLPLGKRAKMEAVKAVLDATDLTQHTAEGLLPRSWLQEQPQG